jgi:hypothetical protein
MRFCIECRHGPGAKVKVEQLNELCDMAAVSRSRFLMLLVAELDIELLSREAQIIKPLSVHWT